MIGLWVYEEFSVKNSFQSVKNIKAVTLEADEILISFDLTSLFSVSELTFDLLKEWFIELNISSEWVNGVK